MSKGGSILMSVKEVETGQTSLNDLMRRMIQFTDAYRHDNGVIAPPSCSQLPSR
jgi:hypothetical protein